MHRTLLAIAIVFVAALALAGLTFSASSRGRAEFAFANGSEPQTLDPQLMTGQPAGRIARGIFEGLTRLDARTLRPAPGVAKSWTISPDRRRYVFRLREDALWSDGEPVTAHDFVYAWRRLLDPALGAEYAYLLYGIDGAEAAHTGEGEAGARARETLGKSRGFWAEDAHTFVVELVAPTPYFLELTAFYSTLPVPRHVVEAEGRARDWFLPPHLVGNGPFRLAFWRVNDRIRLVKSERYWGRDAVALASIDVVAVENATTALNLYLTDELQWLPQNYPIDLSRALRERPDFYREPGMIVYYYRFNTRRPPLDDARVREALSLAVDREGIVEDVLGLGQIPAGHVVPEGMRGYDPPETRIRFDVPRAQALLAEAGYPGGRGFPELGILYNTQEGHKKIAEVIADQLRRHLGIAVKPYNQEWQSYLASLRAGEYEIARAGWIGDYVDPNTFLDIWVTDGGNNQTGWGSPRYDRLIQAAGDPVRAAEDLDALRELLAEPERAGPLLDAVLQARSDSARADALAALRMHLLREAEAILVREAFPIMPIYFYVVSGLVSPRVDGFYTRLEGPEGKSLPNLQDIHPLRDLRTRRTGSRAARDAARASAAGT